MRSAAAAAAASEVVATSHAQDEVVAVVDDAGAGDDGLEVLSVLPAAEVCPDTARRYLDDAALPVQ